ncbi:HalOD1 output domain-containing protein [Haladaptatus sp.]|uniref:HalOD1 output domain-containing protein n=1 Tax=Haladaptatus sp. TaxID=1973141 RepID=UPI003C5492A9
METLEITTTEMGRQALGSLDIETCDGYDPETKTLHVRYDTGEEESILLGIVGVIAGLSGREPSTLTPLYDIIDAESLVSMLTTARGSDIEVSFTYEGYPITVSSSGEIVVRVTA